MAAGVFETLLSLHDFAESLDIDQGLGGVTVQSLRDRYRLGCRRLEL